MAKVKGTVGPSTGGASKKSVKESINTTKKTQSKPTPKKPSTSRTKKLSYNTDSGFDSPEVENRSKNTSKHSATSRVSEKSKNAISKGRKNTVTKSVVKKLSDVSWMKELVSHEPTPKKFERLASGIEVRYPSSIAMRKEDGVDYLMYPNRDGKIGGYVRMKPGTRKPAKKSRLALHFFVLMGKIELIAASKTTEFKDGTMLTIPKGVRYGLQNTSKEAAFLRFQTIGE